VPPAQHLPEEIWFNTANDVIAPGITLAIKDIKVCDRLRDSENQAIRERSSRLWCLGQVQYVDAELRLRTTAFCRILHTPHTSDAMRQYGAFEKVGDHDYEYED